jgi:osmoprotectant transport system permease protein
LSFLEYLSTSWDHIFELAVGHAVLVAISLAIAIVIGVSLGVLVYRRERAANIALGVTSTFLTIPSFALFGLFIPIFGLGYTPAVVALVMYALLPILRNTVTGLRSVDPAISESAQGMGMNYWQRLLRVDMPLAWPVIIAGVRVSTMLLMGIAAIAAVVNGPGLGEDIPHRQRQRSQPGARRHTRHHRAGAAFRHVLQSVGQTYDLARYP